MFIQRSKHGSICWLQQITKIDKYLSWNGFPRHIGNSLLIRLKKRSEKVKYVKVEQQQVNSNEDKKCIEKGDSQIYCS